MPLFGGKAGLRSGGFTNSLFTAGVGDLVAARSHLHIYNIIPGPFRTINFKMMLLDLLSFESRLQLVALAGQDRRMRPQAGRSPEMRQLGVKFTRARSSLCSSGIHSFFPNRALLYCSLPGDPNCHCDLTTILEKTCHGHWTDEEERARKEEGLAPKLSSKQLPNPRPQAVSQLKTRAGGQLIRR